MIYRLAIVAAAAAAITSCLEGPTELVTDGPVGADSQEHTSSVTAERWELVRVIDGDTIVVDYQGQEERIRFIGIDTPETGECGFQEATDRVGELLADGQVVLRPGAANDRDIYDRPLRYVETPDGIDVGLTLLEEGLAQARYDSRDGWGFHPRENQYREVDATTPHRCR